MVVNLYIYRTVSKYMENFEKEIKEHYSRDTDSKPCYITDMDIRWEEMDANGHVNQASYLNYLSEARLKAIGLEEVAGLRKENIGPVIYKIEIEFINEMLHPDTAHIVTWVDESISKTRVSVRQNLYSKTTGKLAVRATFYSIFMDTAKRKPVKIPDLIRVKFGL